ncbi:zinc dependent phospholipase C family protein [Neobacillus mesonae]|nr:zinc dependent phospholipase C family protein [Neobacillus mesonae]
MGSRIMHLIIANRIAEKLQIEDKTLFLLGGVAPDAVAPKELSHFFRGEVKDYTRYIDYNEFLHKYRSQEESRLYILGYYTHLIADDIWLQGFNLSWLKNRMDADPNLYKEYHNDFRLLNGKLLEHYGSKDELSKELYDLPRVMDLDEVTSKDVEHFIPHVLGDMNYDIEMLDAKLNVFTFEQMIGYIETSIDKSLVNIQKNRLIS